MSADVTGLVKDILNSEEGNNGFEMRLQTEQKYRSVRYASTQHSDAARWPKLTITYTQINEAYYLKDHLGNIRVTLDGNGNLLTSDDYYPFGLSERSGDPEASGQMPGRSYNIAMTGNQYKFSGKELDEEGGLDWYYFGARYYDPAIGRWMIVDPLAGKYPSLSSYNYVANNPIRSIDPYGRSIFDTITHKPIGKSDKNRVTSQAYSILRSGLVDDGKHLQPTLRSAENGYLGIWGPDVDGIEYSSYEMEWRANNVDVMYASVYSDLTARAMNITADNVTFNKTKWNKNIFRLEVDVNIHDENGDLWGLNAQKNLQIPNRGRVLTLLGTISNFVDFFKNKNMYDIFLKFLNKRYHKTIKYDDDGNPYLVTEAEDVKLNSKYKSGRTPGTIR